ncbi:hypothetical protein [Croceivirga sp. JEA036]|uniref:hypothetical protein n=1 Tax=Croceivirga sp. JEA036 TaxID=2721162 RepID=UPI001439D6B8|nr:hypothetical protein [Croceivirga sp. JEA036]NJB37375.1 hypothetical protein [Croceivirga sp. JEA036]
MLQEITTIIKGHYSIIIYLVTLIISLITYRKYFDTVLKYFPMLIAYTFLNELLGYFIRYNENFLLFTNLSLSSANDIIYNIFLIIFYSYFFFVYYRLVHKVSYRKIIKYLYFLVVLAFLVNSMFTNPLTYLLYAANAIGSYGLLVVIVLYKLDPKEYRPWLIEKLNLMSWISLGLFIFHTFFPIILIIGFVNVDLWYLLHLRTVLRLLIILMYSLFSIGFMLSTRRAFR